MSKRNHGSYRRASFSNLLKKSAIINGLFSLTLSLYRKVADSVFGSIMTFYDALSEKFENSRLASFTKKSEYGEKNIPLRQKISYLYETSFFSKFTNALKYSILSSPISYTGIVFFSFGFYSLIIMLLKRFAFSYTEIQFASLVTSVTSIVVSMMMFFSKKTLISAINESRILDFLIFDLLSIRKQYNIEEENKKRIPVGFMVIFGIIFGSVTLFVSPLKTVMILLLLVGCCVVLCSPESGIIAIFLTLPFLATKHLIFMVLITEFSYFLKCIRRKRVIKFTAVDFAVLVFMVFIISGGIISLDVYSSAPKMLVFIVFIMTYFAVKNLFRSEKLIMRCINGLSISAVAVSLIGLFQYLFGSVSTKWLDTSMFSDIKGRAVSTFANPNVLGEFLILVSPIIFAMMIYASAPRKKFAFFLSFLSCAACLVFTWSRGAWLGFVVAGIIFIILSSHKSLSYLIMLLPVAILAALFFLNTSVAERLLSIGNTADSSTMYRLNIWRGTLKMLSDKWFYGIGIGTEAFLKVYPQYAYAGTETAPHSHSLYLQLITETGVFSLIIFAAIIFLIMVMVFSYCKNASGGSGKQKILSFGILCGITAFLIQGLTDYVWYNYRIYLLFWLIMGLSVAVVSVFREKDARKIQYIYM